MTVRRQRSNSALKNWVLDIAGAIGIIVFVCGACAALSGAAILLHRVQTIADAAE